MFSPPLTLNSSPPTYFNVSHPFTLNRSPHTFNSFPPTYFDIPFPLILNRTPLTFNSSLTFFDAPFPLTLKKIPSHFQQFPSTFYYAPSPLTLNSSYNSSQSSCTKFISDSCGRTRSLISCENGTLACGNQAQWYGSEINKLLFNISLCKDCTIVNNGQCTCMSK